MNEASDEEYLDREDYDYYKDNFEFRTDYVNSCEGTELCYYIKHIVKGLILEGCPLVVLEKCKLGHINTIRKLKKKLALEAPADSQIRNDQRYKKKDIPSQSSILLWYGKIAPFVRKLVGWCLTIRCEDPHLCYSNAKAIVPSIPLDFVKDPVAGLPKSERGYSSLVGFMGEKSLTEKLPFDTHIEGPQDHHKDEDYEGLDHRGYGSQV